MKILNLHYFLDVEAKLINDFGILSGMTNENVWKKKDIGLQSDDSVARLTLWGDQVIITV